MSKSKLAATFRHDFPHHEAIHTFEAGIPAYFIQLIMEVLEQHELNPFQVYILQFMLLEVNTLERLAYFLGVDEEALLASVTDLLKIRYIEQGDPFYAQGVRPLILTDAGRLALEKQGPPPVPTRKTGRFSFNALTWTSVLLEEGMLAPAQAAKQGLVPLPAREMERPTLGTFTEEDIKIILGETPAFRNHTIVALLKLKEVAPRYIAPVTVVVLQHRDTREKTVAVYRDGAQQRPETEALQRSYESGAFQLPVNDAFLKQTDQKIYLPPSLSLGVAQEIQELVQNEQEREEIEIQVETNKIQKSASQDARERAELETKSQQLQQSLRAKSLMITKLRQQLRQNKVEFLRTEQHRGELIRALREAKEEVIIISPWMNRSACDDVICNLIGNAISRGVRVRIGYGMGHERNRAEASRNQYNIEEVKRAVRKCVKNPPFVEYMNDIVETAGTHQKILICDRQFAITGSFNWLSYTGKRDEGYRQELSAVFRQSEQVQELADIALQVWQTRNAASIKTSSSRKRK